MFTLNTQSEVTLTVYSILGQEITQIQSGNMRPGFHSIQWNGLDQSGIQVASGVYFYQLNVAGQSKTGKMMLLK
jgi:flagellar hook assembly protein FlgD